MTTQCEGSYASDAENSDDVNESDLIHKLGAELEDSSEGWAKAQSTNDQLRQQTHRWV